MKCENREMPRFFKFLSLSLYTLIKNSEIVKTNISIVMSSPNVDIKY